MDGKTLAARVLEQAAARVEKIRSATGITPALATVLVGDDPGSATYVRMKRKRCETAGMQSVRIEMPEETTTGQLVAKITELGADPAIHGIPFRGPLMSGPRSRRSPSRRMWTA